MPRATKTSRPRQPRKGALASGNGSVATPYELKSLGGKDYYICLRDTETPVAKILRGTLNKELLELKQYLDGKMPPNDQAHPTAAGGTGGAQKG